MLWCCIRDGKNLDPGWEKFGSGIRDGKNLDSGSWMEKILIRDKLLGSATLANCKRREGTADRLLRAVVSFGEWAEGYGYGWECWPDGYRQRQGGQDSAALQDFLQTAIRQVRYLTASHSVGDPDPDPHDFGPLGSGSVSQRYGSGSFPLSLRCWADWNNSCKIKF